MSLLMIHFSKRFRYHLYNNITNTVRRCKHISHEKEYMVPSTIESVKYPGYKVIYMFPFVIPFYILNKIKRNYTIFLGLCIPSAITTQILNFISVSDSITIIVCNSVLVLLLHVTCYLCNNVIGSIAFKEDNQKVIISYINYWGNRVNLKVDATQIVPLIETPNIFDSLYKNVVIVSYNQKLKIYIKHGKITEKSNFDNIFGNIDM